VKRRAEFVLDACDFATCDVSAWVQVASLSLSSLNILASRYFAKVCRVEGQRRGDGLAAAADFFALTVMLGQFWRRHC